jgi:hypothetical protein
MRCSWFGRFKRLFIIDVLCSTLDTYPRDLEYVQQEKQNVSSLYLYKCIKAPDSSWQAGESPTWKMQGTMLCAPPPQLSPICKQCVRVHKIDFRRHGYFLGPCLCSIRLHLKLIAIHSISWPIIMLISSFEHPSINSRPTQKQLPIPKTTRG